MNKLRNKISILGLIGFIIFAVVSLRPSYSFAQTLSCATPHVISFPFAVQGGEGGVDLQANALVTGDVRSNKNVAGEFFAKVIGNVTAVGSVTKVIVTGNVATGAAPLALPVLNAADWQAAAAVGGVINQNIIFTVNSSGNFLGPVQINGNLVLEVNSEVTILGPIFVNGNITVGKNAKLHVSTSLGSSGTVLLASGLIEIHSNGHVDGNGTGGFLLVASTNASFNAINLQPNFISQTTVFYALNGTLIVGSNSSIIGAFGKFVNIEANARVNFVPELSFATFICPPVKQPTMGITKSANSSTVIAGNNLTFTLKITNGSGSLTANNVLVTDLLDPNFEFVSSSPPPTSSTVGLTGTNLTWNLGNISPLQSTMITIQVKAKFSVTSVTSVVNKATLLGGNFAQITTNIVALRIDPLPPGPNPTITGTKTASKTSVIPMETYSYTIKIDNANVAALGVVAKDVLDSNLTFVSSTPPPTTNMTVAGVTTLTWNLGTLAAPSSTTITLQVTAKTGLANGTVIKNSLVIIGTNFGSKTFNSADVTISVSSGGGGGGGGGSSGGGGVIYHGRLDFQFIANKTVGFNYPEKLTLKNTGSNTIPAGFLELTVPSLLLVTTATPAYQSYNFNVVTWLVPSLVIGSEYVVNFSVKPIAPNVAAVSSAKYMAGSTQIAFSSVTENIGLVAGVVSPPPDVGGGELPRTGAGSAYLLLLNLPLIFYVRKLKLMVSENVKKAIASVALILGAFAVLNYNYFSKVIGFWMRKQETVPITITTTVDQAGAEKIEPNRIIIASLGITAPIIEVESNNEEVFQEGLQKGIVHYPNSAKIGETGNAYVFGHSSDYPWSKGEHKNVFALLPKINIGDEIIASNADGNKFIYKVIETKVIAKNDLSYLAQDKFKKELTLQTSYPIGTALKRFIVRATLQE